MQILPPLPLHLFTSLPLYLFTFCPFHSQPLVYPHTHTEAHITMALTSSLGLPLGTIMPAFELPGTDGHSYSPDSFAEAEILVIVFTCNHCPYSYNFV